MAMSDCGDCWSTPCVCGKEWPDWIDKLSITKLKELIMMAHTRLFEIQVKEINENNNFPK